MTWLLSVTVALLGVNSLPSVQAHAQCEPPWVCGDANGSGILTSSDVITLIHYVRGTGVPPVSLACTDVDDHELVTVRDVARLAKSVFELWQYPNCGPTQPPVTCIPSTDYILSYSHTFPANATSYWMNLTITAKPGKNMQALHLPFRIEVGGATPGLTYDSIVLPNELGWSYNWKVMDPDETGLGDLLLQFQDYRDSDTGFYLLASIRLTMPASASARPITLKWNAFQPIESGQPTSYPMLLDDTLGAWIPYGLGTLAGQSALSGTVFDDSDGDCSQGLAEAGLSGLVVRLLPPDIATVTDNSGFYVFDSLSPGVYTVEVTPPLWSALCPGSPASHTKSVGLQTAFTELDFALDLDPVWDLRAHVGMTPARAGKDLAITAMCINQGSAVSPPAVVELFLPVEAAFSYSESISAGPGTYSPGSHSVTWSLGALNPGESETERLRAILSIPQSTPLGTPLCAMVAANPPLGDADSANNVASDCREVVASSDPNSKSVSPVGTSPGGFVPRDETLSYHIDFQNTGSDSAMDVVIRDSLDLDLDIGSVQSGVSSHPYTLSITGRELTWTFSNVQLPDSVTDEPGSHAFVEYTIRPSGAAPVGAQISNHASVRIDSDPPAFTDTVINSICPTASPGDVDGSGMVTSADIIYLVNAVFKSGPPPVGALGDINCNLAINSGDIILLVNYVFKGGPPPCSPC